MQFAVKHSCMCIFVKIINPPHLSEKNTLTMHSRAEALFKVVFRFQLHKIFYDVDINKAIIFIRHKTLAIDVFFKRSDVFSCSKKHNYHSVILHYA